MTLRLARASRASFPLGLVVGVVVSLGALASTGTLLAQRTPSSSVGRAVPRVCAALLAEAARTQTYPQGGSSVVGGLDADLQASVHVAALERAAFDRLGALPGEVLVQFNDDVSIASRMEVLRSLRTKPALDLVSANDTLLRVYDPDWRDPQAIAAVLARYPEVAYVQPNYLRRTSQRGYVFASASASRPRVAARRGAAGGLPIREVVVAVVDTGVATSTASIAGRLWTGQRFDDVHVSIGPGPSLAAATFAAPWDVGKRTPDTSDLDGHGTLLFSAIARAVDDDARVTGVSPRYRFMPVKACVGYWEVMLRRGAVGVEGFVPATAGGCTDSDLVAGIRYALAQGAQVIVLALEGVQQAPAVREALDDARAAGVAVIVPGQALVREGRRALSLAVQPADVDPSRVVSPRLDRFVEVETNGADAYVARTAGDAIVRLGIEPAGRE